MTKRKEKSEMAKFRIVFKKLVDGHFKHSYSPWKNSISDLWLWLLDDEKHNTSDTSLLQYDTKLGDGSYLSVPTGAMYRKLSKEDMAAGRLAYEGTHGKGFAELRSYLIKKQNPR